MYHGRDPLRNARSQKPLRLGSWALFIAVQKTVASWQPLGSRALFIG